jgi:hypothetical protein
MEAQVLRGGSKLRQACRARTVLYVENNDDSAVMEDEFCPPPYFNVYHHIFKYFEWDDGQLTHNVLCMPVDPQTGGASAGRATAHAEVARLLGSGELRLARRGGEQPAF